MTDRELPPGLLSDLRLAWAGSMRRARLRREIEILRYRLAMRLGGWLIRDEREELDALRTDWQRSESAIERARVLCWRAQANAAAWRAEHGEYMGDEVDASDVLAALSAPHSPAEPVSPASTPTETPGGAGEAQEARE